MSRITAFIQARLWAVIIVLVLVIGIYSLVTVSHSHQKALEATLADGSPSERDAAVQGLVENGRLVDMLIGTQNPDEDVTTRHNQRSLLIRTNATASVNRLIAEKKIAPDAAFDTLFLIYKDADTGIKASAEAGLKTLGSENDANLNAVIQRLSNGDPDVRTAASDVLGHIGGDKTAAAVNSVLFNTAAQDSAVTALQNIGAPSVPLVIAHLEDPTKQTDLVFRQRMVGLLDLIAAPPSVPELIKIAGLPGQPSVQRLAQVALADTVLAAYRAVQADKVTLAAAKDPAATAVAQTALSHATAALPAVEPAEPVLRGVLGDVLADSISRSQAALALGQYAAPAAITAVVAALGDYDAQVRNASAIGIQSSGLAAVGPLSALLAQGGTAARVEAAQALGGIGTPAAVAALTGALHHQSSPSTVREAAAVALGRSVNPSVIPTLVQALGDRDGMVADAAQAGLQSPALAKPAIPLLITALSQPTPVPFNASQTLSRMGALAETDVVPPLTQALQTGTASTQTWAAVTLGEIGTKSPAVVTALQGLSKSADPHVQYAASQSLLKLAGA